jgi:hypothetical protein
MTGGRGKSSAAHTRAKSGNADIASLMRDGKAIDRAIRAAARDALIMHMRLNNPVAVWENGKVVWKDAKVFLARTQKDKTVAMRNRSEGKAR